MKIRLVRLSEIVKFGQMKCRSVPSRSRVRLAEFDVRRDILQSDRWPPVKETSRVVELRQSILGQGSHFKKPLDCIRLEEASGFEIGPLAGLRVRRTARMWKYDGARLRNSEVVRR